MNFRSDCVASVLTSNILKPKSLRSVPNVWGSSYDVWILLQNIHTLSIHMGTITAVRDVAEILWCILGTWRRCANTSSWYKVRRSSLMSWFPTMNSCKLSLLAGKPAISVTVIAKPVKKERAAVACLLLAYAHEKKDWESWCAISVRATMYSRRNHQPLFWLHSSATFTHARFCLRSFVQKDAAVEGTCTPHYGKSAHGRLYYIAIPSRSFLLEYFFHDLSSDFIDICSRWWYAGWHWPLLLHFVSAVKQWATGRHKWRVCPEMNSNTRTNWIYGRTCHKHKRA